MNQKEFKTMYARAVESVSQKPFQDDAMAGLTLSQMLIAAFNVPMEVLRHIQQHPKLANSPAAEVLKSYYGAIYESLRTGWVVIGLDGELRDTTMRHPWSNFTQYDVVEPLELEAKAVKYVCVDNYLVATIDDKSYQIQVKVAAIAETFAELITQEYGFFHNNPFLVDGFSIGIDLYSGVSPKHLYLKSPECVLEGKPILEQGQYYDYGRYCYSNRHNMVFSHELGEPLLVLKSNLDTLRPKMMPNTYVAYGSKPYLRGWLDGKTVGFRGDSVFFETPERSVDDWAANL